MCGLNMYRPAGREAHGTIIDDVTPPDEIAERPTIIYDCITKSLVMDSIQKFIDYENREAALGHCCYKCIYCESHEIFGLCLMDSHMVRLNSRCFRWTSLSCPVCGAKMTLTHRGNNTIKITCENEL